MPALLAVSLLTVSLFLDSYLSRVDGFVLMTGLLIVMVWLVRLGIRSSASDPMTAEYEAEIPRDMSMRTAVLWLIIGIVVLLFGAEFMVDGAITAAYVTPE